MIYNQTPPFGSVVSVVMTCSGSGINFFAVAARIMRRVLVDYARARLYAKRGGEFRRVDLKEALMVSSEGGRELVEMDEALDNLAEFDSRKAKVVEMRYFGGLTAAEIAVVLGVSPQSVNRDWNLAKAWLARKMTRQERNGCPTHRNAAAHCRLSFEATRPAADLPACRRSRLS